MARLEIKIKKIIDQIEQCTVSTYMTTRLEEHESNLMGVKDQVEDYRRAKTEVFIPPSKEWIKRKVSNLREILEKRTAQSALLIRKLFGEIVLTPVTAEDGTQHLEAKTRLQTFSLMNDPDLGSISSQWWRWGESNPRPRNLGQSFLHV